MGGTLNSIYNNTCFALNMHYEAMARLQEQVYTGSRINRASDDPSTAYRVLGLNSREKLLENYMANISDAYSVLDVSSSVITSIKDVIVDVRAELTKMLSDTYNESQRTTAAGKINEFLERLVSSANTKHSGQYLFGGGNTSTAPYAVQRTNGEITSVTYQGSFQQRNIEVAPGVQSNAYHIGEDLFSCDNRSTPVFVGDTGAAAGSATSSVKGDVWLTVTDGGGGTYDLSIDDGATTVNTDGTDANLAVTNAAGEVLYVDTTNIGDTGVDMVTVPGTYNIFDTLISVRDLLKNERELSTIQLSQCRNKLIDSLEEVKVLLIGKESSIGSKTQFIYDLKISLDDIRLNTVDEATLLQEADIAQVAIDISRREVLYQMSLSVAAKLMSMSLLDFVR
ncbi:MAG: flagellar hook-associated protein FlgL [Planctomycetota bacterium]|jgi:flagellar hook-associated protein 3 FlgL